MACRGESHAIIAPTDGGVGWRLHSSIKQWPAVCSSIERTDRPSHPGNDGAGSWPAAGEELGEDELRESRTSTMSNA